MQCMSSQVSISLNKGRLYFYYTDQCQDSTNQCQDSTKRCNLPITNVRIHKVPRVLKAMSQSNQVVAWVSSQAFRLIRRKEVEMDNGTTVLVNLSSLEKRFVMCCKQMENIEKTSKTECFKAIKTIFQESFVCNACSKKQGSCIKSKREEI